MNRIKTAFADWLLLLGAGFCSVYAVVSSYNFPVEPAPALINALIIAAVIALPVSLLKFKGYLISLPIVSVYIWRYYTEIIAGGKWVISAISGEYSKWGYVKQFFEGSSASSEEIRAFFTALTILTMLLTTFAICIKFSVFYTFLISFPLITISILDVRFPPDPLILASLIAVYAVMLISTALVPSMPRSRARSVFIAVSLTAMLMASAYFIAPPDKYSRSGFVQRLDLLLSQVLMRDLGLSDTPGWPIGPNGIYTPFAESADIADAGPRSSTGTPLMEIVSDTPGTFYLRGYSMTDFDGRAWSRPFRYDIGETLETVSQTAWIPNGYNAQFPDEQIPEANIQLTHYDNFSGVCYLPYNTFYTTPVGSQTQFYSVAFYYMRNSVLQYLTDSKDSKMPTYQIDNNTPYREYTNIEPRTADRLRKIASDAGITAELERSEIADAVARLVSSSAAYSLSPTPIPSGEDFAVYFIESAAQGYCIHFTTAAVQMLRALGIPARYTSGFAVTIPSALTSEQIQITDSQAHAWAEIFYDDIGWVPLEVTPGGARNGVPMQSPHTVRPDEEDPDDPSPSLPPDEPNITPESPTTSPSPTPSNSPQTSPSTEPAIPGTTQPNPKTSITIYLSAALIALLALRRITVSIIRALRLASKNTNESTLYAYKLALKLCGNSVTAPQEITAIAEKAKFSQHTLTEQERGIVVTYANNAEKTVRQSNFFKWLYLKLILCR